MLSFAQWLQATSFSVAIQSAGWAIPLLQSIHILMIGIVFVSMLMIVLRVLGLMRMDEGFMTVWNRFAPWMWNGLIVMVVTGVLLVVGEPVREFTSTSYWLKMTLLVIGVGSAAAFRRTLAPAMAGGAPGPDFSTRTKTAAVAMVLLWLAIIFLGRAIAYDVEVWGAMSLSSGAG